MHQLQIVCKSHWVHLQLIQAPKNLIQEQERDLYHSKYLMTRLISFGDLEHLE